MRRLAICGLIFSLISGCATDIDSRQVPIMDGHFIIAGPGSRIISQRRRFDGTNVLCTEPSPDVAKALASSGNGTISGGGGGASGSLGGGFTSSQTITKMDGRSAGVVALRDGLYFACQAYANGVLGHNTYSLVLSEYSVLLGELLKSGDASGDKAASTASAPASAPGVALTVVGGSMTTGSAQPKTAAAGGTGGRSGSTGESQPKRFPGFDRAMLVSCIAESDPSRIGANLKNEFLQRHCNEFMDQMVKDASTAATMAARR